MMTLDPLLPPCHNYCKVYLMGQFTHNKQMHSFFPKKNYYQWVNKIISSTEFTFFVSNMKKSNNYLFEILTTKSPQSVDW